MSARFTQVGRQRALSMYADWTDRIAKGELPAAAPDRPQGRERNVVITNWDYGDPKTYIHDAISTDRWIPTVNANGPIYGSTEVYFPRGSLTVGQYLNEGGWTEQAKNIERHVTA